MTFSTRDIIDFANDNFGCAWESVAPVRVTEFDLGNGEVVRGTLGGEIALWFCRPDGRVFDVLPGLQSPALTLAAMREAARFYSETGASDESIWNDHQAKSGLRLPGPAPDPSTLPHRQVTALRQAFADPAGQALAQMSGSKVMLMTPAETITVVEPGGLPLYMPAIHAALSVPESRRTPDDWKSFVFEEVLG